MKKLITVLTTLLLLVFLAGCGTNSSNDNNNNNASNNTGNETSNGTSNNTGNETGNNNNNNGNSEEPQAEPATLKIADYYPIKENTKYVYEGTGNEYASYSTYIDYTSENKFQQRVDNGGTVMANVVELKDGKLTKVYSRGEAYYRENLLEKESNGNEVLLMEPLQKGTTWTLSDSRVRTITNTSVEISTPAGKFQAIEVTTESGNDKTMDYYAKNVGLVKSVFVSGGAEVISTLSKVEENVPLVQSVNYYYPNIDDGKFYFKTKEIQFKTNDITRQVLEGAYKEAVPADNVGKVLSEQAKINSLHVDQNNNVYIDLNKDFLTNMNAGGLYEQMILQSIANTFGQYYKSEKVYLTIDNNPYESGHIAMEKGEYLTVNVQDAVELK